MVANLITANVTTPGAVTSRSLGTRFDEVINVMDYGAVADGAGHALSVRYGTLAAAQAHYPFATSLTQQIDYCALKAASNAAFGADGSENVTNSHLNRPLYIPSGQYILGTDKWLIRNLCGGQIYGDGKRATILRGNTTILAFDGVWYTEIRDMAFEASAAISGAGVVELDGNVPGHPYTTRGVQAVIMRNVLIAGAGSDYCLTMVRQGTSGAQGSECQFINLHMSNCALACYIQNGYNALDNLFIGGDCQTFSKNGLEAMNGTINVYGMSFESQAQYGQYLNDGYDIDVGIAGAIESCSIIGCRSESMRFLFSGGGVNTFVAGCSQNIDFAGWAATHAFAVNSGIKVLASDNTFRIFYAQTGGTSGATEPTWPLYFTTVNDGTIVWVERRFNWIYVQDGFVETHSCQPDVGDIIWDRAGQGRTAVLTGANSPYQMTQHDTILAVDATSGPVTIRLPLILDALAGNSVTKTVTIKKIDTSANAVTIALASVDEAALEGATQTIAGGSRGYKTLVLLNPGAGLHTWYVIGSG